MIKPFQIRVPGSTANLGPGFDSIGVALNLYLTLDVTPQTEWEFVHIGPNTPDDTTVENHLVYKIAQQVAIQFNTKLPPCKVTMQSELPLARGLGSSAAAIVAGIELANQLGNLQLSTEQKLTISSQIEGHPDNATASVVGGITISSMIEEEADTIQIPVEGVSFVVIIPNYELKTADARAVLPDDFKRSYAVSASANANMLVANLLQRNFKKVGYYMEQDLFHEPFRAKIVQNFFEIKQYAKQFGAYGTALSGAGPTMISLVPNHEVNNFVQEMSKQFSDCQVIATIVDNKGIQLNSVIAK